MRHLAFLCAALWLCLAVTGAVYLSRFEATAAPDVEGYPSVFPAQSRLATDETRPTLVFFAHPKCPCTRASLRELARLMTDLDGRIKTHIVFVKPKGADDEWANTDLRSAAEAIPNANVVIDDDEVETNIFNAQTSSLTLVYDRDANLRFGGGITLGRGHEGNSPGRQAIFDFVISDTNALTKAPVFGCPLHKEDCDGEMISAPSQTDTSFPQ